MPREHDQPSLDRTQVERTDRQPRENEAGGEIPRGVRQVSATVHCRDAHHHDVRARPVRAGAGNTRRPGRACPLTSPGESTDRRPESRTQAQTWDKVKCHAVRFGLCHACASQLAWGHQLGFVRTTRPPCHVCASVVAGLPVAKPNGWRTVAGAAHRVAAWYAAYARPQVGALAAVPISDAASHAGGAYGPSHDRRCLAGAA
jgi:hypothetical protein